MRRQLIAATALACLAGLGLPGTAEAATPAGPTAQPATTTTTTPQEGTPDCTAGTVTTTWETTTTGWTWSAATGSWAPQTPVVTTSTSSRPLTATERVACDTTTDGVLGAPPVMDDITATPAVQPTRLPVTAPTHVATRTYTASAETYRWKASAWFGNRIAAFDDDLALRYRENAFLWMSRAAKAHTGYSRTLVTFTAPVTATTAQLVAAYDAAAPAGLRITATTRLGKVTTANGAVTDIWLLGRGATATAVWGPAKAINPTFLGRR